MTVVSKWRVASIEDYGYSKKVKLTTVYEGPLGENEENKRFTKASPSGEIWITIDNPYASEQFKPNQEWKAYFELCEPVDKKA